MIQASAISFFLLLLLIGFQCVSSLRMISRITTIQKPIHKSSSILQLQMQTEETFSSIAPVLNADATHSLMSSLALADDGVGYSKLSLYFTLFLYVLSLPGLFSLVTRSVKTKPVLRVYDIPGPATASAKPLRQVAGEIMAYFKSLNYEVSTAEDVITFKGVLGRSNSQAAFLTFCTFMGLGSLGLILSVIFPDLGAKAYLITLLSPYAGIYYWKNVQRVDEVSIKMESSDDEQVTSISAQGGKEDLERFSKALNLPERGKVYIRGIFEGQSSETMVDSV